MVSEFKFLTDNKPAIEQDSAGWVFGRRGNLIQYQYDIVVENHYGIHSFLRQFPSWYIVPVLSIIGPNGRIHNADTDYDDGWGFDITSDLISVEWVRFRNGV
jgi:hypothetical protein